ncbi:MAG: DNA primase [Chloroflexi bacterium CG07_land_8_20_14_0_80_45_17]|nr:MAG: DNA primase [Chloroflexi bacterium CG23_combo_of_CG06-09_8_20_14_all_45_10]PIU57006.1 MAG: DNA primase [Chloroflexi bacterium CG07_land_8_20_14_0_80_45_17]
MTVINEVKQRTDIVEIVSDYVSLQKAGRNFKALCPFHSEKHPSFFVFPEQQTWHCFGACSSGGDVFSFVMKKEGIDFGQGLRLLAQRAGITLISPQISKSAEDEKRERLFQINEAAAEYYRHLLLNTKAGEPARAYLSKRKITPETMEKFRLGFSPDSWEALKKFLTSKRYEEGELAEAGLIIEKEGGGNYDRFRNRLMFPICDIQGRVTGFGARVLDESLPKYINSPQTQIFDKSGSLYGIDQAKTAIRRENSAVIVEGYMDVLRAHQHGWQNVVASMGISVTEKQVAIIQRLTRNIALSLDADAAGEEATLRSAEVLVASLEKKVTPIPTWSGLVKYENILNAEIKVIPLPQGKDPDKVIDESPDLWQNLVEQALPILDFAFATIISKIDPNKAKDKSLAIQKLLPLVYEIKDPVRQAHYVQKLARRLTISESILAATLRKSQTTKKRQRLSEAIEQSRFTQQLVSNPIEEYCLALLLQYPELRQASRELSTEHFESTENREVFIKWQCTQDSSKLKEKVDANLLEHLNYLMNKPILDKNESERQQALNDCILSLQERFSKRLEAGRELMFNLTREKEGVNAELAKLDEEGIRASEQLKEIFIKRGKPARTKEVR